MDEKEKAALKALASRISFTGTALAALGVELEKNRAELVAIKASLTALADATTTPPVTEPEVIKLTTVPTDSTIGVNWSARTGVADYLVSRDGKDSTGAGAWAVRVTSAPVRFEKLLPSTAYTITVEARDASGKAVAKGTAEVITKALVPAEPANPGTGGTTPGAWSTGVWARHDWAWAEAWFKATGRAATKRGSNVCAFATHDSGWAALTGDWWAGAIPFGHGLSLRVPLVPKLEPDLSRDTSGEWKTIARQATAVDDQALICPGWEFNLPGWAHKITPSNYSAWIVAFKRAYTAMKSVNPKLVIGLNPNGGDDGQTGVSVTKVIADLRGFYDALGPDQYDCYPPMTNAANIATQLNRVGGLNWYMAKAAEIGVPLIVPEWGVSQGGQWPKSEVGGDNPEYIRQMFAFFDRASRTGKGLLLESYFNENADYLRGAIIGQNGQPVQNPNAAAAYLTAVKKVGTK